MAGKWRRRRKSQSPIVLSGSPGPGPGGSGDPATVPPPPPHDGRQAPASTTPLADYLSRGHPGVDDGYVVLPRSLVEAMPLPWQQRMVALLTQFHDTYADAAWPSYRVVPSRRERLVDLDEGQLAEAGYLVEIDAEGAFVYRERSGRRVTDPDNTVVLVPCLDPIVRHGAGTVPPGGTPTAPEAVADTTDPTDFTATGGTSPAEATGTTGTAGTAGTAGTTGATGPADTTGTADPGHGEARSGRGAAAAPMNIGPQPVWRTTTPPPRPAEAPPLPPPPTASTVSPAPGTAPSAAPYSTYPVGERPASPDRPYADGAGGGRDWFDEMPTVDAGAAPVGPAEPPVGDDPPTAPDAGAAEFGPTGDEPTEIPYRYRR